MANLSPRQFQQLRLPGTDVPVSEPSPGPHGPPTRGRVPVGPLTGEVNRLTGTPRRGRNSWNDPDYAQQTTMLRPTQDIIENVHKIDTAAFDRGEDPVTEWKEVRSEKRSPELRQAIVDRDPSDPVPPIRIQKFDQDALYPAEDQLWDGHHRLEAYEHLGHTEVPVWESFDEYESNPHPRSAGKGYSGAGWGKRGQRQRRRFR